MNIVVIICWLLALIFFGLAALAVPPHPRWAWIPAGLFFLTLAMFLMAITGVNARLT